MATHKPPGKIEVSAISNDDPKSCTSEPIHFPSVESIEPVYHSRIPRRTSSPTPLDLGSINDNDFPVSHYLTRSVMRQCQGTSDRVPQIGSKIQKRHFTRIIHCNPKAPKTTTLKAVSRDGKSKKSPNRKKSQAMLSALPPCSPVKRDSSSRGKTSGLVRKVKEVAARVKQNFKTSAEKKRPLIESQAEIKSTNGEIGSEGEKNDALNEVGSTTKKQLYVGSTTENLDVSLPVTCFGRGKVQLKTAQSPVQTQNLVSRRRRILWAKKDNIPKVSTPLQPRLVCNQPKENDDVTEMQPIQKAYNCSEHQTAPGSSSSSTVKLPERNNKALQQEDNARRNTQTTSKAAIDTSGQDHVAFDKSAPTTVLVDRVTVKSPGIRKEVSQEKNMPSAEQSYKVNPAIEQSHSSSPPSTSETLTSTVPSLQSSCESNAETTQPAVQSLTSPKITVSPDFSSEVEKSTITLDSSGKQAAYRRKSLTTNEFRAHLSSILLRRERIILMLRRLSIPDTFIISDKLCSSHLAAVLKEKLGQVQTVEEKKICIQLMNHFYAARAVKQRVNTIKQRLMAENPASSSMTPSDNPTERCVASNPEQSTVRASDSTQDIQSVVKANQQFDTPAQSVRPVPRVEQLLSTSVQPEETMHVSIQCSDHRRPETGPTMVLPPTTDESISSSEQLSLAYMNVSRKPKSTPGRSLIVNAAGQSRLESQLEEKELSTTSAQQQTETRTSVPLQPLSVIHPTVAASVLPSTPTSRPSVLTNQPSGYVTGSVVQAVSQKPGSDPHQAIFSFPKQDCQNPTASQPRMQSDIKECTSDTTLPISVAQRTSSVFQQTSQRKADPPSILLMATACSTSASVVTPSALPLSSTASLQSEQRSITCPESCQRGPPPPVLSTEDRPALLSSSDNYGIDRSHTQPVSVDTPQMTSSFRVQPQVIQANQQSVEAQLTTDTYAVEKHLAIPSIVKGREIARDLSDFVANLPVDDVTDVQSIVRQTNPEEHTYKKRCVDETEPEVHAEAKRARVDTRDQHTNLLQVIDETSLNVHQAPETERISTHSGSNIIATDPALQEPRSRSTHPGALQSMPDPTRCETCVVSWKLLSMYPYRFYGRTEIKAESILNAYLPLSENFNIDGMDDAMLRQNILQMLRVGRHYGWKPHLYTRDLVFQMFTVGELRNRVFRTLDPRRIVAIRQCINENFRMNDFLFRVVCERFVNKTIRELFSAKLSYLMSEIDAHSVVHGIDQQVASVVAAVTNSS